METRHPASAAQPPKVLLIEDDPDLLEELKFAYEQAGFAVSEANTISDGIDRFAVERPHLVVTDIVMKGGGGLRLLGDIAQGGVDAAPVICITGDPAFRLSEAYDHGAYAVFQKPFEAADLIAASRRFLKIHERQRRARDAVEVIESEMRQLASLLMEREGSNSDQARAQIPATDLRHLGSLLVHEINGPLAVINMNAAMAGNAIKDSPPRLEAVRRMTEAIEKNSNRLLSILHAFKKLVISLPMIKTEEEFPVAEVMADAVAQLEDEGKLQDVALHFDGPAVPVWIRGERQQLSQVLRNLLDNAAFATRQAGRKSVHISVREEPRGTALISVRDEGTGIPEAIRDRIFDMYFTTKGNCGTGMGLFLCRKIVEKHEGRIEFVSGPDGAEFTVSLPALCPA